MSGTRGSVTGSVGHGGRLRAHLPTRSGFSWKTNAGPLPRRISGAGAGLPEPAGSAGGHEQAPEAMAGFRRAQKAKGKLEGHSRGCGPARRNQRNTCNTHTHTRMRACAPYMNPTYTLHIPYIYTIIYVPYTRYMSYIYPTSMLHITYMYGAHDLHTIKYCILACMACLQTRHRYLTGPRIVPETTRWSTHCVVVHTRW